MCTPITNQLLQAMSLRLAQCLRLTAPLLARAYSTVTKPKVLRKVVYVGVGLIAGGAGSYCAYCSMQTAQAKVRTVVFVRPRRDCEGDISMWSSKILNLITFQEAAAPGTARLVLYQYANCPFCSKVRAYLHYTGEQFDIVEVRESLLFLWWLLFRIHFTKVCPRHQV